MTTDTHPETLSTDSVLSRFMLGFEGTTLPPEMVEYLSRGLAGVAIYSRNYRGLVELCALTQAIHAVARRPVLIGIDQEGGSRFAVKEPFTPWPSAADLGRLGDEKIVEEVGRAMGVELRTAGCNLNFAPMLDLHTNPDSPVTRDRSFGSNPQHVARLGAALHRGLRDGGVLSCAKHFPGHGNAAVDPHHDLPVFAGTMDRLVSAELVPFSAAVAGGVPLMMTAHILLPQIDAENPASFSRKMLVGVLREQMEFQGVILADDLGMGAIAHSMGPGKASIETIRAGTDIVMLCHDWKAVAPAIAEVMHAHENGSFDQTEWRAARARIERVRSLADSPLPQPSIEVIGCTAHRKLADEIHRALSAKQRTGLL